jgi:hypothetical protein
MTLIKRESDVKNQMLWAVLVAALAVVAISQACNHITGPSLTAVIERRDLVPTSTSTAVDPSSICCCKVTGTIRNTSSVPVNISFRFVATNKDGKNVGTAVDWQANVDVNATRNFTADGIYEACSRVPKDKVVDNVLVIGLYSPQP